MGCSSSKTAVLEAPKDGTSTDLTRGNKEDTFCDNNEAKSFTKYPASEAFIVSAEENAELVDANTNAMPMGDKKPPKRIQQLIEQAAATEQPLKLQDLEDKLNKAESRRKEYLQQKVENIQKVTLVQTRKFRTNPNPNSSLELSREQGGNCESFENDIKSKALDDDSKQELLTTTLTQ